MLRIAWREASWGIVAGPARSLTIVIAVAGAACCVLFCSAIIGGFDQILSRMNFGLAASAVTIRANPVTNARTGPPTDNDLSALRNGLRGAVADAAWVEGAAPIRSGDGTLMAPVFGARGAYARELDTSLVAGRWLSGAEMEGNARLCLLGAGLSGQLGENIRLDSVASFGGLSCRIVGIMAYPETRPARRFADAVVMPIGTVRRYFVDTSVQPHDLAWITLFFADDLKAAEARQSVDRLLRRLHGIPQSRLSPYRYDDPDAQMRDQERQRDMMARLLGSVTGITLLVSVFSYAAVMLAACRSRVREFGIRMAMGATREDVGLQIITENIILSIVGSVAGTGAGALLSCIANAAWGWTTMVDTRLVLLTVSGSLAIGTVIGCYAGFVAGKTPPAKAAR